MSERWSDKQRGEFVRAVRALEEIISAYTIYIMQMQMLHIFLYLRTLIQNITIIVWTVV